MKLINRIFKLFVPSLTGRVRVDLFTPSLIGRVGVGLLLLLPLTSFAQFRINLGGDSPLRKLNLAEMAILGPATELELRIAPSSRFVGGNQILQSGREFISGVDFDRLSFNVDRTSAGGRAHGTVMVMGKRQTVDLVFENGKLVDWTHTPELDRILDFDENLKRIGYVSFRDNEVILNLGGALVEALDVLPESEELLPDFFNTSLYKITCSLERNLDVVCTDNSGIPHEIMKNGLFVE